MRTIAISKLNKLNQKEFEKVIFAKGDLTITKYNKPLAVLISIEKYKQYIEINELDMDYLEMGKEKPSVLADPNYITLCAKSKPRPKLRVVRAKSKSKISRVDARKACSCPKSQDQIELITAGVEPDIMKDLEKEKVYCDDCKYLRDNYSRFRGGYTPIAYFCYTPYNLVKQKDFKSNWKQPVADPQELNFNNNCKYHKRKWYKFWK